MIIVRLLDNVIIAKKIEAFELNEKTWTIEVTMDSGNTYSFEYDSQESYDRAVTNLFTAINKQS